MKPDSTDTAAPAPGSPPPVLLGPGQDEFPEGAAEFTDEPSRRRFLTIMSASVALATGCNLRPAAQRKIVPYTTQPDELTPGVPTFYASAAPLAGYGHGVLVRSNEGRPTKIEGNPDHPSSLGGAGVHALASILDAYDPDRSRATTRAGSPASYEQAVAALRAKLFAANGTVANQGVQLRILTETVTSPTLAAQIDQLLKLFPKAKWVRYDAVSSENAREGVKKAFGRKPTDQSLNVVYDFNKADVVLALDSDFLCFGPGATRYSRDFADRRKLRHDGKTAQEILAGRQPGQKFKEGVKVDPKEDEAVKGSLLNRLYAVETMPTNTGAVADHRLALTSGEIESFARAVAQKLGMIPGVPAPGALSDAAKAWVDPVAADLKAASTRGGLVAVIAGDHMPPSLHALVMAMNKYLGAINQTVRVVAPVEAQFPAERVSDLKTLTAELNAKAVDVLLILGGANPAYSAPADIDFAGTFQKNAEEKAALAKKGRGSLSAAEQKALDYLNNFLTFHLGTHQDETGVLCEWHVPEAHYLETWGDIRGHDGTASIQQPLIAPLHGGKSAIELLGALLPRSTETAAGVPGSPRDPMDIVQATWRRWFSGARPGSTEAAFQVFWQESVRSGVVAGSAAPPVEKTDVVSNWAEGSPAVPPAPAEGNYEVNFRACPALFDGRYANNGWLQELPKPLTKISWDNAAFVSPATAKALGVGVDYRWTAGEHGRAEVGVIEIDVGGKKVKAPAWVLPGHAENAVTVHLGHGRERAGRVAGVSEDMRTSQKNTEDKPVHGFNAYPLRTSTALWSAAGKLTRTGKTYYLACTQGHWAMVEKDPISGKILDRKPVRRGTLAEFNKNPQFAKITPMASGETDLINQNVPVPKADPHHKHDEHSNGHKHDPSHARVTPLNMYAPAEGLSPGLREFQRRRWAMAIDLNACTGCSACVVACQSENNIPVVGKDQVTKGREMYWISIDRYYDGTQHDADGSKAYFQPRMCVQCENAPCEIVCPVGATVHSTDGLNDMTYNRCVGTRYCSNNCPYKVRRFNFLTLQDWETDTIKLGRNPDVSVRSRGVMEKCTFCVQRIRGAEIVAERELAQGIRKEPDPAKGEVLIQDGEILTACQAACPSAAIVFGDINDPHAKVSEWKNEPQNYGLLAELNTRPRLTHMAVVRNPNPAMPKA